MDLLWRSLWGALSFVMVLIAGSAAMAQWASMLGNGPDLAAANPIIVFAALRQFWEMYGGLILATAGSLLLAVLLLWVVLESLFRGGLKGFWTYLGTGIGRSMLLFGTLGIFLMLSSRDESGGTLLIGGIVVVGIWFLVGLMESVVRRNAVDLLATDLGTLSMVMGSLRLLEVVVAFILLGSAASAWMRVSDKAIGALWFTMVFCIWLVIDSYLVAVRYSAIDIMRSNVVGR